MRPNDSPAELAVRERYRELAARVDQFFARVRARHGALMQCRAGCSACCRVRLSVTTLEARLIREGLAQLSPPVRERLAWRTRHGDPGSCPALDEQGRCDIHPWRPLVCRSHGVPIRYRQPEAEGCAPEEDTVSACELNFEGGARLPEVSADCVLDQNTLSTVLGALEAAYADARGTPRGERVALSDLLREPTAALASQE